jgi:hypothetical protein
MRHGTVQELTGRAKAGCDLCAIMLETASPAVQSQDLPYQLSPQTWIAVQVNPLLENGVFGFEVDNKAESTCKFELFSEGEFLMGRRDPLP